MNASRCLCYSIADLAINTTGGLSTSSLQCLADQPGFTQPEFSEKLHRDVSNIVWSSLTTILACTWVSCHPNISFDKDKLEKLKKDLGWGRGEYTYRGSMRWKLKLRIPPGIKIILVALVTPEFIVMWALRQYIAAKDIEARSKGMEYKLSLFHGNNTFPQQYLGILTINHAFFSLMGGYVITDQKRNPVCALVLGTSNSSNPSIENLNDVTAAVKTSVKASIKASMTSGGLGVSEMMFYNRTTGRSVNDRTPEPGNADAMVDKMADTVADTTTDAVVNAVVDSAADAAMLVPMALAAVLGSEALETALDHAADEALANLADSVNMAVNMAVNEGCEAGTNEDGEEEEEEEMSVDIDVEDRMLPRSRLSLMLWVRLRVRLWDRLRDRLRDRTRERLRDRLQGSLESFVSFREDDIKDKSKQDWLAKTFALGQTLWFVTQCVARKAQHLPLTEIELMTCAYAALSAAIYVFWWNKPFRVNLPFMIHSEIPHKASVLPPPLTAVELNSTPNYPWKVITLAKFLQGSIYDEIDFSRRVQVPTFYSGYFKHRTDDSWNFLAEIITAAVFGGIHLFAWNYEFPTRTELWIWRLSALVIVTAPPITFLPVSILTNGGRRVPRVYVQISEFILPTIVLLYIISRLAIFVLAVVSLQRLPAGALIGVSW